MNQPSMTDWSAKMRRVLDLETVKEVPPSVGSIDHLINAVQRP